MFRQIDGVIFSRLAYLFSGLVLAKNRLIR